LHRLKTGERFALSLAPIHSQGTASLWAFERTEFCGRPSSEAILAVGYFCAMFSSFSTSSNVQGRIRTITIIPLALGRSDPSPAKNGLSFHADQGR
jgi:hypothetical protein